MTRPKYSPRPDKNHGVVSGVLKVLGCSPAPETNNKLWVGGHYQGYNVMALDLSSMGGQIDWLIWVGCIGGGLEVKAPDRVDEKYLTDGEKVWNKHLSKMFIVSDYQDVLYAIGILATAAKYEWHGEDADEDFNSY